MSAGITIVGLGPGGPDQLTLEAWRALQNATEVYLRTAQHPAIEGAPKGPQYRSFDDVYEQFGSFEAVYDEIARRVLTLGQREEGVVYAVPGHPLVGEATVARILAQAEAQCLPVKLVAGLSFLEPTLIALGIDAFDGLQICDATLLAKQYHPNLDPDVAALVVQVYNRRLAAEAKLTLMNLYHDDQPITLVCAAGTPQQRVRVMPLYALDRQDDLDHLASVYIPPVARRGSLSSYQDVVAHLRAPDGCPWDREQTHQSLRTNLLEETYEVLAALDADDMHLLREELGDLLLQVLLHAQIAAEDGDFRLIDSTGDAMAKLIRRHPHVFGDATVNGSDDVLRNWEQIKREEKGGAFVSMLSGLNKALPALTQAVEMQRRVARVGFDWPAADPVIDKVREELDEFRQATETSQRAAELGDILFSLANVARWHEIDAESALREACARFARRFGAIERYAAEQDRPLEEMSLDEMDALWERAKSQE